MLCLRSYDHNVICIKLLVYSLKIIHALSVMSNCYYHVTLQKMQSFLVFRCRLCLPITEPSAQRPRTAHAGHAAASRRARIPPARAAAAPARRLDQRRRRATGLAHETARRRAGGGAARPKLHHSGHLPLANDVRRAHRGQCEI